MTTLTSSFRRLVPALLASILAVGLLAACGESEEDKAKSAVCDAKADISKQVDSLSNVTPTTGAVDQVQSAVTAIQKDIKTIGDNVDKLADDLKGQVQQANQAFEQALTGAASALQSLNAGDAASQLTAAVASLGTAYKSAYADVKC